MRERIKSFSDIDRCLTANSAECGTEHMEAIAKTWGSTHTTLCSCSRHLSAQLCHGTSQNHVVFHISPRHRGHICSSALIILITTSSNIIITYSQYRSNNYKTMDPISITTSSIALLSAAKAVCDFIARIADAPKFLSNAKDDVEQTIASVHSLCACLEDRSDDSVSGRDQLVNVLIACRGKCEALKSQLEACSKHSAGSVDGKLSLLDRGKLLMKEKEIGEYRNDIACFRGAINVAAFPLLL